MLLNYKTTILIFIFVTSLKVKAQEIEFYSDVNFGIPISSSLKNFHQNLTSQIPFSNIEQTDNLGYNYGFTLGMRFMKKGSVFFSNRVSGAKSSVADYSGKISLSNELKGYTIGLKYETLLKEFSKSNLNLGIKGLITKSNVYFISESRVLNNIQEDKFYFNSLDLGTGIGLNYEYSLKFIILRVHLDLDIYIGGKLKLNENNPDGGYLTNDSGKKVTTGWSGFTGGMGLIIPVSG